MLLILRIIHFLILIQSCLSFYIEQICIYMEKKSINIFSVLKIDFCSFYVFEFWSSFIFHHFFNFYFFVKLYI